MKHQASEKIKLVVVNLIRITFFLPMIYIIFAFLTTSGYSFVRTKTDFVGMFSIPVLGLMALNSMAVAYYYDTFRKNGNVLKNSW